MKKFIHMLRNIIIAPAALAFGAIEDIDMDELTRAVDRRTARAEAAVLRDYFAQHGLEGDEAEQAAQEYRDRRRENSGDSEAVRAMRERAEKAEKNAQQAQVSAQTLVQLARMGVPESCEEDVLLLVSAQMEKSEKQDSEAVRSAVETVLARLPGLTAEKPVSSGSRGSYPRQDGGVSVWQAQLDRARASGDNAAAVGIINAASQKGINLR